MPIAVPVVPVDDMDTLHTPEVIEFLEKTTPSNAELKALAKIHDHRAEWYDEDE